MRENRCNLVTFESHRNFCTKVGCTTYKKNVHARVRERSEMHKIRYIEKATMHTAAAPVIIMGKNSVIQPIARLFRQSCFIEKLKAKI